MAGQQQIIEYNKESLLNEYTQKLICEVKKWYMNDKFNINTGFNENEAIMNYLLKEAYSFKSCELEDYTKSKIKGELKSCYYTHNK